MAADRDIARAYEEKGDYERAIMHYQRALAQDAEELEHYTGLVHLYEKTNRLEMAQEALDGIPQSLQEHPLALYYRAKLLRRGEEYEQALAVLERVREFEGKLSHNTIALIFHEMGVVQENLSAFDAAFQSFQNANQHIAKTKQFEAFRQKSDDFENMKSFRELFQKPWIESCPAPPVPEVPAPVSLVGFPRSGTTLMERILDAHPLVQALPETNVFEQVMHLAYRKAGGFMPGMASFTKKDIGELQEEYYRLARGVAPLAGRQVLLDKNPLNMRYIGHLCRVFARPKVILALRHPCDCILSAFKQNFTLSTATIHMLSLRDTVNYYKAVFDLMAHYRDVLDFPLHIVRYEDVVADPEREIRKVLDFMGLSWREGLMEFYKNNEHKPITSSSYHQASRPIYKSGLYQWKNYEKYMAPFLPELEPYISEFGYRV